MGREYNVSLDLGSDTMKIACAFLDGKGNETVLKVVDPRYSEIAIPAVACYDQDKEKWLFGYEVGRSNEKSYATVVKIKDLLSIAALSRDYYTECHRFPLFEFPITNTIPASYYTEYRGPGSAEKSRYARYFFTAGDSTPKSVCAQFFAYAVGILAGFFRERFEQPFDTTLNAKYTLIVKPQEADAFVSELRRLFNEAIRAVRGRGIRKITVQTSAKVLGMLAAYYDSLGVSGTESALLFDIGEERISVVKFTKHSQGKVSSFSIDGVSGHSLPRKLGGNDIDKAVVEAIEKDISGMEAIGTGAEGTEEHLHETGSKANNYLFMKSVKAAKVILGREYRQGYTDYPDGVPVSVIRDVDIYTNITQDGFARITGTRPSGKNSAVSVADRIADYILAELRDYKAANGNVHRIYLTGGAAGTAGLADYVQTAVNSLGSGIKVKTFAGCLKSGGNETAYSVKDTDIFSYGPAVGAALVSLRKDEIAVCLTKSYGRVVGLKPGMNEANFSSEKTIHYAILANMGSVLDFEHETLQETSMDTCERYVKDADGKVIYKEYWSTFICYRPDTDVPIYSANITDSSVFPGDKDVPEDIQKLYRSGCGNPPVSYFIHARKNGMYWLRNVNAVKDIPDNADACLFTPQNSDNTRIQDKDLAVLHDELGFVLEGGNKGEKRCLWYRDKTNKITNISKIRDTHNYGNNDEYYVDYGVRIDKDGYAVVFARLTEDSIGYDNSGKRFDIQYQDAYGRLRMAYGVPPEDLIADFDKSIKIDTGNR